MSLRHQAVGAYRRWSPPSFDKPSESPDNAVEEQVPVTPVPEAEILSSAEPEPEPAPDTAHQIHLPTVEEIERLHEETRASAHAEGYAAGREEGYTAGFDEGHAAGFTEGKAEVDTQAAHFRSLVENLEQSLTHIDQEVAEDILALSIEIARKMVQHELRLKPEGILETIRSALQQMPHTHLQITLHPEDHALVRNELGENAMTFIEDDSLTRGGCLIKSSTTEIDASIETRWRRLLEALGDDDARWEPDT